VILGLPFPLVNLVVSIWQGFSAAFTHTNIPCGGAYHGNTILFVGSVLQRHCGNTF
jgi:hypothetical protein